MPKRPSRLTAALHRYRTEGDTPARHAFAVALGLYIGASPFIGLHLALSVALGWLFGLNRLKVYLAANISNPFVAPLLYGIEIQIGTLLRTGHFLSAATLHEVRLQGLAIDILVGSVIVGSVLAIVGGVLTYLGSGGRRGDPAEAALVAAAAERYLAAGLGPWELAHAKMRMDPVYLQVIRSGRLPSRGTLLDLGCGQGLLLALVATAAEWGRRGEWPVSWSPPPVDLRLHGIEQRPRVARRARQVLENVATIEEQDLARWSLPACDVVLLIDVMHLLSRETQDRLLAEVPRMMPCGGVLLIREADAAGGWRFAMVRAGNRLNAFLQGRSGRRFCFDSAAGWSSRLEREGFDVEAITRHDGGPFANVLLQARLVRGQRLTGTHE
jgi:SAM-dependent methyltransferase